MLRLYQEITAGSFVFPFCTNVEIQSTRNNFTDTAIISLPNRIPGSRERISDVLAQGTPITIKLGYYPDLFTEFTGYISQIVPNRTAVIKCENESYVWKRRSQENDIIQKNTTVRKVISALYNGELDIQDGNIGDWKISKNSTLIDVLNELYKKFRMYSYFRGTKLVVGATAESRAKASINAVTDGINGNVPIGETSIEFQSATAEQLVVKGVSVNRAGKVTEVYAFFESPTSNEVVFSTTKPATGNIQQFNINGQVPLTESDLQELCRTRLLAVSRTGINGTVTIYGNQFAQHGDNCVLSSSETPEINGTYSIDSVTVGFGVGVGYRKTLGLGIKIA